MKPRLKRPKIVYAGRKPVVVLLDLATYEALLERLEDAHDANEVARRRKISPDYRPLNQVLKELGLTHGERYLQERL